MVGVAVDECHHGRHETGGRPCAREGAGVGSGDRDGGGSASPALPVGDGAGGGDAVPAARPHGGDGGVGLAPRARRPHSAGGGLGPGGRVPLRDGDDGGGGGQGHGGDGAVPPGKWDAPGRPCLHPGGHDDEEDAPCGVQGLRQAGGAPVGGAGGAELVVGLAQEAELWHVVQPEGSFCLSVAVSLLWQ